MNDGVCVCMLNAGSGVRLKSFSSSSSNYSFTIKWNSPDWAEPLVLLYFCFSFAHSILNVQTNNSNCIFHEVHFRIHITINRSLIGWNWIFEGKRNNNKKLIIMHTSIGKIVHGVKWKIKPKLTNQTERMQCTQCVCVCVCAWILVGCHIQISFRWHNDCSYIFISLGQIDWVHARRNDALALQLQITRFNFFLFNCIHWTRTRTRCIHLLYRFYSFQLINFKEKTPNCL